MEYKISDDICKKAKARLEEAEKIRQYKSMCKKAKICYVCGGDLKRNSLWNIFNSYLYCSECDKKRVFLLPKKILDRRLK